MRSGPPSDPPRERDGYREPVTGQNRNERVPLFPDASVGSCFDVTPHWTNGTLIAPTHGGSATKGTPDAVETADSGAPVIGEPTGSQCPTRARTAPRGERRRPGKRARP